MFPLDFEEFVRAIGPHDTLWEEAQKAWDASRPLASEDRILYLPVYMIAFLKPTALPDHMIYDI